MGCINQRRQGRVKIVSLSDQGAQMLERIDEAERQVLARLGLEDRLRTELRGLLCAADLNLPCWSGNPAPRLVEGSSELLGTAFLPGAEAPR
jgi:hypothetical protein